MKYLKYILLSIILSAMLGTAISDPLDKFVLSFNEQETVATWVKENAQTKLTDQKALLIVREVYSQAYSKNINPQMLLAIMKTESGFRNKAKSSYGAVGLMQVVPRFHRDKLKHRDPTSSKVSVEVGSQILLDCLNKHKQNISKSLNCYSGNAGKKYFKNVHANQQSIKLFVKNALFEKQVNVATYKMAFNDF